MGFKTARRKCEGENSTVNRMNSTVLYRKNVLTEKNFILKRAYKDIITVTCNLTFDPRWLWTVSNIIKC